ncbi:asparaginase, partial [Thermus scotoductus]|uniref:asparaginase n=1 Tax=Thermus scotoductus TaxID=37636 RepID=UPI000FFFF810
MYKILPCPPICSGRHACLLAAALALGGSPEGYGAPVHPGQVLSLRTLREPSGVDPRLAIDACSARTWPLPLSRPARAFSLPGAPDRALAASREPLRKVQQILRPPPELVAGPGRIHTLLMARLAAVAKQGADGYYGLPLLHTPHGPLRHALDVETRSPPSPQ